MDNKLFAKIVIHVGAVMTTVVCYAQDAAETAVDPLATALGAVDAFRLGKWLGGAFLAIQLAVWALKKWGKSFLKRWNVTAIAVMSAASVAVASMVGGLPWWEAVYVALGGLGPAFVHDTLKNIKGDSA